jgi:hypothetical protein
MTKPASVIAWNESALERSNLSAKELLAATLTAKQLQAHPTQLRLALTVPSKDATESLIERYVALYDSQRPRGCALGLSQGPSRGKA